MTYFIRCACTAHLRRAITMTALWVLGSSALDAVSIQLVTHNIGFPESHTPVTSADGSAVPVGNRLALGTFDFGGLGESAFFSANAGNVSALLDSFITFSPESFDRSALNTKDGQFQGVPGQFNVQSASFIQNTQLQNQSVYLFVFQTADNSADLGAQLENLTHFGVFSSTDSDWNFGADDSPSAAKILRTSDVNEYWVANGQQLQLVAVPEPAAFAAVFGLAVFFFVVRRRLSA